MDTGHRDLGDLSKFDAFFDNSNNEYLETHERLAEGSPADVESFCTTGVDPTPTVVGSVIMARFSDTAISRFPTGVTGAREVATSACVLGAEV